jgi:death on curing protein
MGEADELTIADVRAVHEAIMREGGDVPALFMSPEKSDSALRRPALARYYEGADLAEQVARLIDGIATGHAFLDGNKRTATATGELYLRERGFRIASPSRDDTTLGRQVELLVSSRDAEALPRFAAWLRAHIEPLPE